MKGVEVFSAWIRFGGKGLALLVENVEVCYVDKEGKPLEWIEWTVEEVINWSCIEIESDGFCLHSNLNGREEILFSFP